VLDYLDGLTWDGTSRLDTWLEQIMKAAKLNPRSGEYLSVIGRKFMIGAVARAFKPGAKMDNMLVFEGGQGRGKSTAVKILGDAWYSDTPLDLDSKDAFMALSGCWWLEWGEMDALSRAEVTRVKASSPPVSTVTGRRTSGGMSWWSAAASSLARRTSTST
jgi:predicted P-loop ATPase